MSGNVGGQMVKINKNRSHGTHWSGKSSIFNKKEVK